LNNNKKTCPACGKEIIFGESLGFRFPKMCECQEKKEKEREEKEKETRKREKLEGFMEASGLGKRFKTMVFKKFKTESVSKEIKEAHGKAWLYAKNFEKLHKTGRGILFYGNTGVGKTHLASAIAIDVMRHSEMSVIVYNVVTLFRRLKEAIGKGESVNEITKKIKRARLAILDDIDKVKSTDWTKEILYDIINTRYENMLPLIVTCNSELDVLDGNIGEASMSRLYEMCRMLPMHGKDWRRK